MPKVCPANGSGPILALLLSVLLAGPQAEARPRDPAVPVHAWDRDVGRRHGRRPTRSERKRLRFTKKKRDVPFTAAQAEQRIEALRDDSRVRVQLLGRGDHGNPIYRIDVPALGRRGGQRPLRVVVSSWLHGNETAGPAAAFRLVDFALRDKGFRQRYDLSVMVKVDPWLARENPAGRDLNRAFAPGKWTAETRAIRRSLEPELQHGGIDLFVDLHGAVRKGFFLIRGADDGALSRRILSAMESGALLDARPSKPKVGPYNLHALGGACSTTGGTFKGWMQRQGVPYSYTLEAPRKLAAERQVAGLFKLLRSTLDNVARHGRWPRRPGGT